MRKKLFGLAIILVVSLMAVIFVQASPAEACRVNAWHHERQHHQRQKEITTIDMYYGGEDYIWFVLNTRADLKLTVGTDIYYFHNQSAYRIPKMAIMGEGIFVDGRRTQTLGIEVNWKGYIYEGKAKKIHVDGHWCVVNFITRK